MSWLFGLILLLFSWLANQSIFDKAIPTPMPTIVISSQIEAEHAIEVIFGPDAESAKLIFLACENRYANPYAVGAYGERGIAQIHPIHSWRFWRRGWTWDDAFDITKNLWIAKEIFDEQGWRPWTCASRF